MHQHGKSQGDRAAGRAPLCNFINVILIPKGLSRKRRLLADDGVYMARVPYINRPGQQVVTIECPTCNLEVVTNSENDIGAGPPVTAETCRSMADCPGGTTCDSGVCKETCAPSDATAGCGGTCATKCADTKECSVDGDCTGGSCDISTTPGTCLTTFAAYCWGMFYNCKIIITEHNPSAFGRQN